MDRQVSTGVAHLCVYPARVTWTPDKIRNLRDSQGWTQDELADALGASRRAVQDWEAGKPIGKSNVRALTRLESQLASAETRLLTAEEAARQIPSGVLLAEVTRRFAQIPSEEGSGHPGQRMVWPIALGPHGVAHGDEPTQPITTESNGEDA